MALIMAGTLPGASLASGTAPVPCKSYARDVLRSSEGSFMETAMLRTLYVEAKPSAKAYKVGDTVKIAVNVSRPANEDVASVGLPMPRPTTMPAEGVNVGVGMSLGNGFFSGFGVTDQKGDVTVKIKLQSYATAGKADITIYAYETTADSPCLRIEENGYRRYPKMFAVKG